MVDSPSSLPGVVATARWCPEDTQDRDFCKRGQKSEGICLRSGPSSCGKSVLVFAIFLRDGAVPAILVSDGPADRRFLQKRTEERRHLSQKRSQLLREERSSIRDIPSGWGGACDPGVGWACPDHCNQSPGE